MSRDADLLLEVLDQALTRLDLRSPRRQPGEEETSAGTCWELAERLDNQLHGMVA